MVITFVCKRLYTNRDLIDDQFGRLFHIPVRLARLGHRVSVFALDYRRGRPRQEATVDGVRFVSIPAAAVFDIIALAARVYSGIRRSKPDILVASGDTHIGGLTALIARVENRPWVFDVYDDYRYFASAKIPGMTLLFRRLLRQAAHVVTASRPLASRFAGDSQRITVVENGVDPLVFRRLDKAYCRSILGISPNEAVIGYLGSITRERGIDILLQAFKQLRAVSENARLLLAGHVDGGMPLKGPGIDYRGLIPQSEIPVLIGACDVAVIPYVKDPLMDATNACKIAEYLACGVPVVATRVSNMAELFSATPEILAEPGSPKSLFDTLRLQLERRIVPELPEGLLWQNLTAIFETAVMNAFALTVI